MKFHNYGPNLKMLAFIMCLSEHQNFREGRIQFLRCIESLRARVTTDRLRTIVLFVRYQNRSPYAILLISQNYNKV